MDKTVKEYKTFLPTKGWKFQSVQACPGRFKNYRKHIYVNPKNPNLILNIRFDRLTSEIPISWWFGDKSDNYIHSHCGFTFDSLMEYI